MKDYTQLSNDIYSDITSAPEEVGTPYADAAFAPGPQERMDSCAIRAQQHVLSMFGINVSETDLVNDAINHGEYSPDDDYGTSIADVGNLLERNGIDVHRYEGATMAHLISELGQGHKIIVGIDANEVIASDFSDKIAEKAKDLIAEAPNHAVVVSNVDPYTLDVDIVDPADGQLHRIPASTFMDAWHDSNCFMASTNAAPNDFDSSITNNSYNTEDLYNPIQKIDLDGDGQIDVIGFDYNGDHRIDEYFIDTNHDGFPDIGQGGYSTLEEMREALNNQMPQLGSLGHVSGVFDDIDAGLGGLGHVGQIDDMPQLGSLGHVSGISEDIDANLGGLGHVGQIDDMPQLGSLGHVSGTPQDINSGLGGLGHVGQFENNGIGVDIDGDGINDINILGIDNSEVPDVIGIDLDGDGVFDIIGTTVIDNGTLGIDLDGDGIADFDIDI